MTCSGRQFFKEDFMHMKIYSQINNEVLKSLNYDYVVSYASLENYANENVNPDLLR